jgi:hypothetical protein
LIFVQGDQPMNRGGGGIYSVGEYDLPREPSLEVHLAPGNRNIGYSCPGYVFVDNPPSVWHKFEGALTYEMTCEKGVPIFRVRQWRPVRVRPEKDVRTEQAPSMKPATF